MRHFWEETTFGICFYTYSEKIQTILVIRHMEMRIDRFRYSILIDRLGFHVRPVFFWSICVISQNPFFNSKINFKWMATAEGLSTRVLDSKSHLASSTVIGNSPCHNKFTNIVIYIFRYFTSFIMTGKNKVNSIHSKAFTLLHTRLQYSP